MESFLSSCTTSDCDADQGWDLGDKYLKKKKSLPKFECFETQVACIQYNKARLAIYAEGCLACCLADLSERV